MVLTKPQADAAARRIIEDRKFDQIAGEYICRKLRQSITPSLRTSVAQTFRHACLDFLRRGAVATAAEYRHQAEALERALEVLVLRRGLLAGEFVIGQLTPSDAEALNMDFADLMASGDGGACARRAVEVIAQMAIDLRRVALEHERDDSHIAFFYMIGRHFKHAGWPLPSASQAIAAYEALTAAVQAECPQATMTVYTAADGSAVRRAMKRGAGGKVSPPK